jgi:regulator of replication initiation timing
MKMQRVKTSGNARLVQLIDDGFHACTAIREQIGGGLAVPKT